MVRVFAIRESRIEIIKFPIYCLKVRHKRNNWVPDGTHLILDNT